MLTHYYFTDRRKQSRKTLKQSRNSLYPTYFYLVFLNTTQKKSLQPVCGLAFLEMSAINFKNLMFLLQTLYCHWKSEKGDLPDHLDEIITTEMSKEIEIRPLFIHVPEEIRQETCRYWTLMRDLKSRKPKARAQTTLKPSDRPPKLTSAAVNFPSERNSCGLLTTDSVFHATDLFPYFTRPHLFVNIFFPSMKCCEISTDPFLHSVVVALISSTHSLPSFVPSASLPRSHSASSSCSSI